MSYDETDPRLTAYVLDEADADERAALEEAVASDPALKSIVDELSNASRALVDAVKAEGLQSEELHNAQRSQIEARAAEIKHPRRMVLRRRLAYAGVAAALLVLAGTLSLKGELERNIAAWFPTPEEMVHKGQPKTIAKNGVQQLNPEPVAKVETKTILAGEEADQQKIAPQLSQLGDLAEFNVAPNGSSASGRDGSAHSSDSPPTNFDLHSVADAKTNRARELVAKGQFYIENKKFDQAKDAFDQSLQIDPGNNEAKRMLSEATVGAYNDEIDAAWKKRAGERARVQGGIDKKLPEGSDDIGIKEPPRPVAAGDGNIPKIEHDKIEDLNSLGYAEETREQIAKSVSPGGLADLDEYQVDTQGNNATLQRGSKMSAAKGEFDPTLRPNSSENGAIYDHGATSYFNWQDTDSDASDSRSVLGRVVTQVDVNGDGIVENIPIYTKPDGTNVGNNSIARGEDTNRQRSFMLDFQRNIPESISESYAPIVENPFTQVSQEPLSTFGLDVDTASYANTRRFLNSGQLPPPNAVRIEEFVNAFKYEYAGPSDDRPVALRGEIAGCPWNPEHRLARIAVKAKDIPFESQPPLRLTFLIDVSGSMEDNNKLPLLRESMKALVARLRPTDQVAIVTYRDTAQRVLSPTPGASADSICAAIDALHAEGSTNGAGGIELAYAAAKEQFLGGGLNRVILATDGDFNVGETENAALVQRITEHAKSGVYLTVLGFGIDNLQDDRLEGLADKGNGNYFYIDSFAEANKVLVDRMAGTIAVAAKDVKIQVEFNPAKIGAYRLLGYENRALAAQDFNDDRKDAGDLGAGHTVTALYELVPVGVSIGAPGVDELKYQKTPSTPQATSENPETMTVKLRYKKPDASESERIELPLTDTGLQFDNAPSDFKFATSAAAFAMLLRNSQYAGSATLDMVQQIAESATSGNADRSEFVSLVVAAKTLSTRVLKESKASDPTSPDTAGASLNTVKLLDGGELNGIAMNAEQHEITVTVGTPIRGHLIVETFNAMHAGAVAPLCGTVDWGERSEQPWLAEGWIKTGKNQYVVNVDKAAPNQPGTYHIIVAFRGEYNPAQVMSITNWEAYPDQRAVWSDGNDIGFDWTPEQYRQAEEHGVVRTRMLEANGQYSEVWQPAAIVTVHVRGN
ncbi:MAG: von Willebrand factor type A domain-containing protein [Candidatus Hydrogenedentes bacterium]|nr:von Willebrand factor type A domain-containing protein [Candidatus Hydrogenedentota bacterium]